MINCLKISTFEDYYHNEYEHSSLDDEKVKLENAKSAVKFLHDNHPELHVDGEIQADFALNSEMLKNKFPFSKLAGKKVNTLIFPNLSAGNISYKLLQQMTDSDAVGPILIGMRKSIHVVQLGATVREIINMVKVAVIDAQNK